jgi:glycine oxidase
MADSKPTDLLVVGGGVIGLSVAWQAAQAGMSVTVLERDVAGEGTSRVAAGMLAPVAEVEFGAAGRRLLDLGLHSAALWPAFAEELAERSGMDVGLRRTGTLLLAADADEAAELERQLEFRRSLGLDVRRLAPSAARELEPALAPALRMALEVPDDHAVDPRLVLAALRRACEADGVALREHEPVLSVELDAREGEAAAHAGAGRVTGVALASGEHLGAGAVVLAAGPWSGGIEGLPARARVPVRPVKGQILLLRDPEGPGLLDRVLRYTGGYVVPRGDGRYVLGATVEERGFELGATAGGVYELLRDAHELLPGIAELEIEELSTGLRPGTPDNLPAIGRGAFEGLLWATGHHRNGILLAPLTARLIVSLLDAPGVPVARDGRDQARSVPDMTAGSHPDEALLAACDPARLTTTLEPAGAAAL